MQNEAVNHLADKIARLISVESKGPDLFSLQKSIDAINSRLDKLEAAHLDPQSASRSPQSTHPSQERFSIAEAIDDEIFAGINKEKACTFEPNGKPCDHCSMCSSRGF